ncbi:MAG: hypothetical protein ACI4JT_10575 [Oscillospiraceae bacterium]
MKEERLLKTLGDVDEKFIDESAPDTAEQPDYTEIITRKEPFYMKILPIAACAAVVGICATIGVLIHNNVITQPSYQQSMSSYPTCTWSSSVSDAYRVPRWDELEINEQYTRFEWQGYAYNSSTAEISAEKLGELLGETTASGVDEYTDEKHEITVSVYPIAKINKKTALAVQFPEDEKFYVYYNRNYVPQTLGDFIDDLNLTENLKISTTATCSTIENLYMTDRKYSDIDTSKLMEILLSGRNVPTESMFDYNTFVEGDRFDAALEFAVDIPILGIENLSLEITKGGFVHTNAFCYTSMLFYLGTDKTDPFVQYVKENCPSKITWQSDEPLLVELSPEEQDEVVSLFKNLAYIEYDLHPDLYGYFPDCVDSTVFITEEIIGQRGIPGVTSDKMSEENFYLVKNATEEEFKEKLREIFTDEAAQDYLTKKQITNLLRFKDGKTYVAKETYLHDLDLADSDDNYEVVISADEISVDGFAVTVTAYVNGATDDYVRQTIKIIRGVDGKLRIGDNPRTFDDIKSLRRKNVKISFSYNTTESHADAASSRPAS